jgi:release factor glutamine methyltransferase
MKAGDLMAEALSAGKVERQDLSFILAEIIHCRPLEIPLLRGKELSEDEVGLFWRYYKRLADYEPLQYILGKCWFFGLEIKVTPDVLIPRPETEGLVEIALQHSKRGMRILEIGTGSGAIAVALKKNLPGVQVTATEIDPKALKVARKNAARHSCEVDFRMCDLYPQDSVRYDLIISNPPYIAPQEYAQLDQRVRDHEPRKALFAEENGFAYYRRILRKAPPNLADAGVLLFEHGAMQREAIIDIARPLGFSSLYAGVDLAGRDRYLLLGRPSG